MRWLTRLCSAWCSTGLQRKDDGSMVFTTATPCRTSEGSTSSGMSY